MYVILLSGGMGKRLWPLSGKTHPKQFLQILPTGSGTRSMVQRVYKQLRQAGLAHGSILCAGKDQRTLIEEQLGDVPVAWEPETRDTFPAIALSCAYLMSKRGAGRNDAVVVVPIDSYADADYFEMLKKLPELLDQTQSQVVLMGKKPTGPNPQYGYIVPRHEEDGVIQVEGFHEKPDPEKAQELIEKGALWNIGVFCFRLELMQEWMKGYGLPMEYDILYSHFDQLPKISFDYQVLENSKRISALRYEGEWRDLGTWCELSDVLPYSAENTIVQDCENVFVFNAKKIPIVLIGIKDAIVVATDNGILVTDCQHAPNLKGVDVDSLRCGGTDDPR